MSSNLDKLNDIYYDVESGFGGEEKLYSQAKAAGLTKGPGKLTRNDVKEWLKRMASGTPTLTRVSMPRIHSWSGSI
jgi:hypothetical protein